LRVGIEGFATRCTPPFHPIRMETDDRIRERGCAMKHVLIVDDSPTMRRMVMASLRNAPEITFHEAANGLEAIERLALGPIDLILLDLNMPDMHGMEVIQFVKSHAAYRDIPVVVLTTRGDEASRDAALAAGAVLYLTKPFDPATLASQARSLMSRE